MSGTMARTIGILQTGRSPETLRDRHGDYDGMFRRLLDGRGFHFVTYPVLDDVFPAHVHEAQGWLITGSRFGVYEDYPWIARLEDFLRRAYAHRVPIVGVCFGHQVLARALGGRVEKFQGGWSAGLETYSFEGGPSVRALAWHQDQVVEKPDAASVVASSPFCSFAALAYGEQAFTVQPHPEFRGDFFADLVAVRGAVLPGDVAEKALDAANRPTATAAMVDRMVKTLKGRSQTSA